MIILDTNVLSELLRPAPDARVIAWLESMLAATLFTTAVSQGEMLYGVYRLPPGQRRDRLYREVEAIFSTDMADRVLAYDSDAADVHAAIAAERRTSGRPIDQSDAMIAGIARLHGAQLATRNLRDFKDCGISLIDPWH